MCVMHVHVMCARDACVLHNCDVCACDVCDACVCVCEMHVNLVVLCTLYAPM